MRDHGGYNSMDWPSVCQYFDIAVMGNGANAPGAPPNTNYPFSDGSTANYLKSCNALSVNTAEVPTRSGTGLYVITYDKAFTVAAILNVMPEVYGASGVWAQVASWNTTARTISVRVFAGNGSAIDLVSTDLLVLVVKARDTSTTGAGKT
jgi:hypothetical protein